MTPKQLKRRRQKQRKAMEREERERVSGAFGDKRKRVFSEVEGTDKQESKEESGGVDGIVRQSYKDERREQGKFKKHKTPAGPKTATLQVASLASTQSPRARFSHKGGGVQRLTRCAVSVLCRLLVAV